MRTLLISALMAAYTLAAMAVTGDDILGNWTNAGGKNKIAFVKMTDGSYSAKILWLAEPNDEQGKPKLDKKNPDEAKRNNPLIGTRIVWGLRFSDGAWKDGTLYSPTKGMEVKGSVKINSKGELELKGTKFGISQTETFVR